MTAIFWLTVGVCLAIGLAVYAAFFKKCKCDSPYEKKILELDRTAARVKDSLDHKVECTIEHPTREKTIYTLLKEQK